MFQDWFVNGQRVLPTVENNVAFVADLDGDDLLFMLKKDPFQEDVLWYITGKA